MKKQTQSDHDIRLNKRNLSKIERDLSKIGVILSPTENFPIPVRSEDKVILYGWINYVNISRDLKLKNAAFSSSGHGEYEDRKKIHETLRSYGLHIIDQ